MNLQTELPLSSSHSHQIDYSSKLLLLGSCFSENIGEKFSFYKFETFTNPFGIYFHPVAIERFVTAVIDEKKFTTEDIFFSNERFHCFDAHSRLSNASEVQLIKNLNEKSKATLQFLGNTSHIIITLGTSWAYKHKDSGQYVANCHKVPQKQFSKELLSVAEICKSIKSIINQISNLNADVKFIFTVSPVRHIKDGFVENMRSKAHLISAIHNYLESEEKVDNMRSTYFPSYEIVMDELRDYRFFNADMLHPNQTAVNYIWERFQNVHMSKETKETMDDVAEVQKGLSHRPTNPISAAHQTFLQKLAEKQQKLTSKYPHIQF